MFYVNPEYQSAFTKLGGVFDDSSLATYLSAVSNLRHIAEVEVRVLDLYDCDRIELTDVVCERSAMALQRNSEPHYTDLFLVRPDHVDAIKVMIKHHKEHCEHRVLCTTNPEQVVKYRVPDTFNEPRDEAQSKSEQRRPEGAISAGFRDRLDSHLDKMRTLGFDVEDDNSGESVECAIQNSSEAAAAYAKICEAMGAEIGPLPEAAYDVIFKETLGESAPGESIEQALTEMLASGRLTRYLGDIFAELFKAQNEHPEAAREGLLKISRVLLLYTKIIPARVKACVDREVLGTV